MPGLRCMACVVGHGASCKGTKTNDVQRNKPHVGVQVKLPIDPGVVLLDIGFTGDDPNHGESVSLKT